jgi:peptide/nickel transport system substrate-binding protein
VTVADQLRTGEVDVGQPDASLWDSLANSRDVVRLSYVRPAFDYYIHNLDVTKSPAAAIFADVRVRRALLLALDRRSIAARVYFGLASPADSSVSAAHWVHTTPPTQYPFDLSASQRSLDAAGWVKGSDGIRSKNGTRLEWELLTNAGSRTRQTLGTVLAEQWRQIGANVTLRTTEFPQLVTRLTDTRQFDMALFGLAENLDPDSTQLWSSSAVGNGAFNASGYRNPRVDDLLERGTRTFSREQRIELYRQVQEVLMEDLPATLLTYPKSVWGINSRVRGFQLASWSDVSRPWFKDVSVVDGR